MSPKQGQTPSKTPNMDRLDERKAALKAMGLRPSEETLKSSHTTVTLSRYPKVRQLSKDKWVFDGWTYEIDANTDDQGATFGRDSWNDAVALIVGLLDEGIPAFDESDFDSDGGCRPVDDFCARHAYQEGKVYDLKPFVVEPGDNILDPGQDPDLN